jgi:hypothetical protein
MLEALERLYADEAARGKVIAGITKYPSAASRLTDIQQHGLMDDYDASGKDRARRQLLDGTWGPESKLLEISAAVKQAYQIAAERGWPFKARWVAGVTAHEILPIVQAGEEAVYLILLGPALKPAQVMEKAAYDTKLLDHLRRNANDVVAFLDSI